MPPSTLSWIDTHVHLRSHRSIARYVELQDRYGMSAMVLLSAPNESGLLTGGRPNRNAEALLAKAEHPERFYVFGGLDLSPALSEGAFADDQVLKLRAMLGSSRTIRFRSVYGAQGDLEVQGLDLPAATLEKLYRTTALGLLGTPKPIGCAAAKREAEVLLERTTQADDRQRLEEIRERLGAVCP